MDCLELDNKPIPLLPFRVLLLATPVLPFRVLLLFQCCYHSSVAVQGIQKVGILVLLLTALPLTVLPTTACRWRTRA